MPKTSKRRTSKRGKGKTKFSKFNLYTHRSAKSQASQIYSLNKKVNSVYKSIKPDIDTVIGPGNPSTSLTFQQNSVAAFILASIPIIDNNTLGNLGQNLDFINIRNVRFQFLYRFNSLSDSTQPIYIRLTFLKLRIGTTSFPSATSIFSENADPYVKVRGPLHMNLYDTGYKIVGDYKYKITKSNPNLDFKISFKGFRLDKGSSTMPKNGLVCYVYLWNPNYAHAENCAEGQSFYKLAYTSPSRLPGNH